MAYNIASFLRRGSSLLTLTLLGVGACGGAQKPPQPLESHFEDRVLAPVPVSERSAEMTSRQEYDAAKLELEREQYLSGQLKVDVQEAKNEVEATGLKKQSAEAKVEAAKLSGDMNKVAAAQKNLTATQRGHEASKKRVEYLESQAEYKKKQLLYLEEVQYAKEAQYELAQAKTAKANGISPEGFNYVTYEQQYNDRRSKVAARKREADAAKKNAVARKQQWSALQPKE